MLALAQNVSVHVLSSHSTISVAYRYALNIQFSAAFRSLMFPDQQTPLPLYLLPERPPSAVVGALVPCQLGRCGGRLNVLIHSTTAYYFMDIQPCGSSTIQLTTAAVYRSTHIVRDSAYFKSHAGKTLEVVKNSRVAAVHGKRRYP